MLLWPIVAMGATHTMAVLLSGYAVEWVQAVTSFTGSQQGSLGPVRYFGSAWLAVGIPLGIWMTMKGRVGLAGLAISPYVLAHYLLLVLWDVVPDRDRITSTNERRRGSR